MAAKAGAGAGADARALRKQPSSVSLSTDFSGCGTGASDSEDAQSPGRFEYPEELRVKNTFLEFASLFEKRRQVRSAPVSVILGDGEDVAHLADTAGFDCDTDEARGDAAAFDYDTDEARGDAATFDYDTDEECHWGFAAISDPRMAEVVCSPSAAVRANLLASVSTPEKGLRGTGALLSTLPPPAAVVLRLSDLFAGAEPDESAAGEWPTPSAVGCEASFGLATRPPTPPTACGDAVRCETGEVPMVQCLVPVCQTAPLVSQTSIALAGVFDEQGLGSDAAGSGASAAVLRLSGLLDPSEVPTVGSAGHGMGDCKPCAFAWRVNGCENGVECQFCHLCVPGEKRRRKKERRGQRRTSFGVA